MSSRRARKFPTCPATGKTRFRTHTDAVEALHAAADARYRAEHEPATTKNANIRCYDCDACGGWHLTSRTSREEHEGAGPTSWPTTAATLAHIHLIANASTIPHPLPRP